MTNIATIIKQLHVGRVSVFLPLLVVALLMVCSTVSAQVSQGEGATNSVLDTIPEEAKAVFNRYVQKQDSASIAELNKHRSDKFIKRFSFHTNVVDWATLVPNIGIEIDLKDTPRNNYSIFLHGKFNGNSRHGKLVYNVNAIRVEGRKYWRTGKYGTQKYYGEIEKLYTDTASMYFNADTLIGYSYYVDTLGAAAKALGVRVESIRATADMTQAERDSLDFAEDSLGVKKSRFRKWLYNTYHKVRRNVTSGRTMENPRNWRAYYLGLWAGFDNWSVSLTGKGKQGIGFGAGAVAGYTLPLLPQKYPHEGSLDLDLGIAVGWKAVKYDAYTYEEHTQHYVYNPHRGSGGWKIVPYPIVQDIHVSLVWRFRGIKNKVDKSLIDDYEKKWIARYNERIRKSENDYMRVKQQREDILAKMGARTTIMADSADVWDNFHKRRLDAAKRLNPDTVFTGEDEVAHLRIFMGIKSQDDQEKYFKEKKKNDKREEKERAKRDKQVAKERADSTENARKDSIRMAKELIRMAEDSARMANDSIAMANDSIDVANEHSVQGDTIITHSPQDSVPVVDAKTDVPVVDSKTDVPVEEGDSETGEQRNPDDEDGENKEVAIERSAWPNFDGRAIDRCIYWKDEL